MRAVGLKVLKNKLSEYVRLAAGGEVVLITEARGVRPPATNFASACSAASLKWEQRPRKDTK